MKKIAPNYYKNFICIADQCKHNCCIGWEIDIDDDTLDFYKEIGGPLGEKLQHSIALDPAPHFILGKKERCPFLDDRNLCEIISEMGKEGLCQICSDHPRFYNILGNRLEIGLGLCCEAAGRLILGQKESTDLIALTTENEDLFDDERLFLKRRQSVFSILQDNAKPLDDRLKRIQEFLNFQEDPRPLSYWKEIFFDLERLDSQWDCYLEQLNDTIRPTQWDHEFEKIAIYLFYRHYTIEQQSEEWLRFILLSLRILRNLSDHAAHLDDLIELARIFSAEIEYSDENIERITNHLR